MRVVQRALTNQSANSSRRRRASKSRWRRTTRSSQLALPIPPSQAVDIRSAELGIHGVHRNRIGSGNDFILGCEDHTDRTDGREKLKLFTFAEAPTELEAAIDIDARARDGLIERGLRGPL